MEKIFVNGFCNFLYVIWKIFNIFIVEKVEMSLNGIVFLLFG